MFFWYNNIGDDMKKFICIMILIIIIIFGLIKIKSYYDSQDNQKTENSNLIEEKQIDKVAINNIVRSINSNLTANFINIPNYQIPEFITDLELVTVRGDKPESINLEIRNMQVYKGEIVYKGIKYYYDNGSITIIK